MSVTPTSSDITSGTTSDNGARRAVVTGASTGIGAATVRRLRSHGWQVVATARRQQRLEALAGETGCTWVVADLQVGDDVDRLAREVLADGPVDAVVNNAGGALGVDPVAQGDPQEWMTMYERNVLAALRVSQAFLPGLRERGGDLVFLTSTAAHDTYPGGAGYVAAKHAERVIAGTLRLELVGEPVRVIEIAPGMVATEEFSLNRFRGDAQAAQKVYAGVAQPLTAQDVAECVTWALERPSHVNIDSMIVRPRAQASNTVVAREG
ncbi:SDR family NAD(P)-dependent oxidoreductase [Actinomyces sp. 2119]|uniref:SDR family NAD(P)-dependent oxidoreductase n=1 Tax=Actinomyces lilanjuaniae TaxID=2321394 RepID=A0ABN5PPF1_9ACTO|nr:MULTISPECIES: SDR family NAD(P)-dependent oxidoreductase [Actinomyces]AYD89523.1 SDR family NAD(P)-dependent oxidoreductase [Actinomyces lilanjuaniae]RJF43122.1 SDR family NAD(P)-dependent oxidoreductase [Actinomyces sp. 2119]